MTTKMTNRALRQLVFAFGLLHATVANAGTYYVATNGNDGNTCSQAQNQSTPKRTMNGGIGCLSSGDTLEMKAGTYAAPNDTVEPPSGTSWSSPTTIRRFGSDTVTIQGGLHFGNWGAGGPKSYIVAEGFIIDAQFKTGVVWLGNGTHHIKIANNELKNGKNHAISGSCIGCWITNNKIHTGGIDCDGNVAGASGATCPSTTANIGYNNAIYIGDADLLIEHNEIFNWAGAGIQVFNSGARPTNNTIIRYNWIHDTSGSWATLGDSLNGAWGIIMANGSNLQAYGNIISNMRGQQSGATVSNNPYGILVMSSCSNCKVYANTIFNNPAPAIVVHASGTTIKNNILWNNAAVINDDGTGVEIISSNNLCSAAARGCSVLSNPLFDNPQNNSFKLQSGSPAIDAGTSSIATGVNWSFTGSAPDIGAYEYGSVLQVVSSQNVLRPSSPVKVVLLP
jgi:parallel beta-helix repeat protein